MSRDLTSDLLTETQAGSLSPILLAEVETASGFQRMWTGIGTLSWNGSDWSGVGLLAGISNFEETGENQATSFSCSLSGIPSDLISESLQDLRQGKSLKIWFGALDATGTVIVDPYLTIWARVDTATISDSGDTATIVVTAESRAVDFERSSERRYTSQDQQIDYPGDLFFDYVPSIQDAQILWGHS